MVVRPDPRAEASPRAGPSDVGAIRERGRGLSRRHFLAAGAALVALPAWPRLPAGRAARRPNVLFVLSDSHRASSTGCYGDATVRTPGFDAFARQGARLDAAVSSTPLCRPYRASLMSGLFAHHHGMLSNDPERSPGMTASRQWIRPELPKLAQVFRDAGYRCGYVGKWHLGPADRAVGAARLGFDDLWFAALDPHEYVRWRYATTEGEVFEGQGHFRPALEVDKVVEFIAAGRPAGASAAGPGPAGGPTATGDAGGGAGAGPAATLPGGGARDGGGEPQPWFVVLSWGPPHEPLEPPPELLAHYADVPLPPNVVEPRARRLAGRHLPRYLALIEGIDAQFARLLGELERLGVAGDTVVVYTSDHGNQMYSQDMTGKGVPYSESTRVPFLVRWPGRIPAGATLGMPFGTPDIAPTLLGLAGLPVPAGLDGRDGSLHLLGDPAASPWEDAYLSAFDVGVLEGTGWRGVRTARHLYARTRERPWLLFDVQEDPFERRNLVTDEPGLRDELDARTRELMRALGDAWA